MPDKAMLDKKLGLSHDNLTVIINLIADEQSIETAIVFGSRAKGNYKPGSDIDIAVSGAQITHSMLASLSYQLNEETVLPYYFDIVHLEKITSAPLRRHIQEIGIVIYDQSQC